MSTHSRILCLLPLPSSPGLISAFPMFGSSFFYIHSCSSAAIQAPCILAVNLNGLHFLNKDTHVRHSQKLAYRQHFLSNVVCVRSLAVHLGSRKCGSPCWFTWVIFFTPLLHPSILSLYMLPSALRVAGVYCSLTFIVILIFRNKIKLCQAFQLDVLNCSIYSCTSCIQAFIP